MRCRAYGRDLVIDLVREADEFRRARATVRRAAAHTAWYQHLRLTDGREYLRWPKVCEFLVASDGRRIISRLLGRTSPTTWRAYLLSHVMSFALLKQGVESLHATAVVINGKAVAFLGDCGEGKSTLAAACLKAGATLLTDDLLVLEPAGNRLLAHPGTPHVKLMPRIAAWLYGGRDVRWRSAPLHPLTSKRIIALDAHSHTNAPTSLHAIYVLRRPRTPAGARIVRRSLPARAAWYELTKGTFNPVVRDPDRLKTQFEWAGRLARRIPVKSLSYPRTLRALSEVVRTMTDDVTGSC